MSTHRKRLKSSIHIIPITRDTFICTKFKKARFGGKDTPEEWTPIAKGDYLVIETEGEKQTWTRMTAEQVAAEYEPEEDGDIISMTREEPAKKPTSRGYALRQVEPWDLFGSGAAAPPTAAQRPWPWGTYAESIDQPPPLPGDPNATTV